MSELGDYSDDSGGQNNAGERIQQPMESMKRRERKTHRTTWKTPTGKKHQEVPTGNTKATPQANSTGNKTRSSKIKQKGDKMTRKKERTPRVHKQDKQERKR